MALTKRKVYFQVINPKIELILSNPACQVDVAMPRDADM
jgi:hypothetical protein